MNSSSTGVSAVIPRKTQGHTVLMNHSEIYAQCPVCKKPIYFHEDQKERAGIGECCGKKWILRSSWSIAEITKEPT